MISKIKKRFLESVRGPVFPIPTPFTEDGEVDYSGIQRYVSFLLEKNAGALMVTVGTSRFDVLTIEEMQKVNETVVKAASGKALTIVTTPPTGPTSQAVAFAQQAEDAGADGILAVFPDRYYSDDGVYEFFKEIADACSIGVLIHEMPITAGRGGLGPKVQYSPELIERLSFIDNLAGLKEESNDPGLIYALNRRFKDRLLVIGGAGGMRAYLTAYQWGQPAYLVGVGNFIPEIEMEFYAALVENHMEKARDIITAKEEPFFEAAVKVGWHLGLKEAMDKMGRMAPWERGPLKRLKRDERVLIYNHIPSR